MGKGERAINILKVMVADDEFPIRKWFSRTIKNLPDMKVDFVGAASNGEEALMLFREKKPDVVFTDIKMPMMDGLELLKMIKLERPGTEVIIITSYDEFAYAKEAISQDAYDYVLKTEANPRMLSDLLRKLQSGRRNTASKDDLALRLEQEIYLNYLLQEEGGTCTREELHGHGIYLNERAMFAVAFHTNHFQQEKMMEVFLNAGVENVLYYPFQKNILIAIGNTSCIDQLAYQNQTIYQFSEKIGRCFESSVGVSGPYYQYGQLTTMITKSVLALNLSFYYKEAKRIFFARDATSFEEIKEILERLEQKAVDEVKVGRLEYVPALVEEIFGCIGRQEPGDVGMVKQFIFRLMANICQLVWQNIPGLAERTGDLYRDIERCSDFDSLKRLIRQVFENLEKEQAFNEANYTPYVAKAIRYIEKRYNRITSVTEVADEVGLNVDYLCHLFKNETGVTVSQFLNSTRMNRAIWLLNNTELKSYEIAETVGYSNQGYFSRLFKQKFQMTPYEFRNMNGKNE